MLRGTCVSAAKWTTASQPASTDSTICGLRTLPCTNCTRSVPSIDAGQVLEAARVGERVEHDDAIGRAGHAGDARRTGSR